MNKNKITAENAFFIKLGSKGNWEKDCIEKAGTIRLGFNGLHRECLAGEWAKVKKYWGKKKTKGKTTETVNQIKCFYTSPEKVLWITFYDNKLYWCFAKNEVSELNEGSRIRRVIGKWCSESINGNILWVSELSGKLTKVQGFQGTICKVKEIKYLLEKINDERSEDLQLVEKAKEKLEKSLVPLIHNLNWKDFELLVDLIFTSAGWKRISVLGKTQKKIDMELVSPVNEKRAFVQVKSESSSKDFMTEYSASFKKWSKTHEMYYVVHTWKGPELKNSSETIFIDINKLPNLIITAGLLNWLVKKSS